MKSNNLITNAVFAAIGCTKTVHQDHNFKNKLPLARWPAHSRAPITQEGKGLTGSIFGLKYSLAPSSELK